MVDISVTVDAQHQNSIDEVVEALRDSGMEVSRVHAALGVVSGSAEDASLPALEQVPGVESVEVSHSFQLPPPDASPQ